MSAGWRPWALNAVRRGGIERTHRLAPQLRIGLLCDRREEPVKIQVQNLDVIGAAHTWERSIFAVCSQ